MKTSTTNHRVCTALGLLTAACVLAGQPAQAQNVEHRRIPIKPEVQEAARQSYLLARIAADDLHAGRYAQAEAEAREATAMNFSPGVGQEVLAAALDAQGKDQEALQAYQFVVEHVDGQPRNLLPYAQLLLKSGQWEQAVTVYNKAISRFSEEEPVRTNSRFSSDVPEPTSLTIALHIARGLTYTGVSGWASEPQNKEAMGEYGKALQLAPDNALTNFYYGSGWQRLTPAEKAKFGNAAQAKAALLKAAASGTGDVKKNAEESLRAFAPPR